MKQISINSIDIPVWDVKYDNLIQYCKFSLLTLTDLNVRIFSNMNTANIYWVDWKISDPYHSAIFPILIDTFPPSSTWLSEDFRDENYRLSEDLLTDWDSCKLLNLSDAQVCNDLLVRQYNNWTNFHPTNTADYSQSNTFKQYYYREFKSSGHSYYNGLFKIGGLITEDDLLNNKVEILISLDGINWYNCNKEWNGRVLSNGSGCRINLDTYTLPFLEFTLSIFYTNEQTGSSKIHDQTLLPGYGLYLKIIYDTTFTGNIDFIYLTNWV